MSYDSLMSRAYLLYAYCIRRIKKVQANKLDEEKEELAKKKKAGT